MFSFYFSVVLVTRSWRPLGTFKRPLGDVWEVFLEAFGGRFGDFWGLLGVSWGYLGRLAAQDAPKKSQRGPQELPKTAPRGPKRLHKATKRVPGDPQEGPRGHRNHPQTTFKTEIRKTSKMMTLSMKINDLGGSNPPQFHQNH